MPRGRLGLEGPDSYLGTSLHKFPRRQGATDFFFLFLKSWQHRQETPNHSEVRSSALSPTFVMPCDQHRLPAPQLLTSWKTQTQYLLSHNSEVTDF